jgi:hypothetical protein
MMINISDLNIENFENKLIDLSKNYSKAIVNLNGYLKLLKSAKYLGNDSVIDIVVLRESLSAGHYANIGEMQIYCSPFIADDEMEIEK